MKNGLSLPTGVICLAVGSVCTVPFQGAALRAQQPTGATAPTSTLVAVVDLPKIFETHPTFKANMESLQQQLKEVDEELEAKQRALNARSQQLNDLNPTSPDYLRLEAKLAREAADLQIEARQFKKDFVHREATQYYAAYNEIVGAVNRIAGQYNIGLVLRFDSEAIDPKEPQSIARGIGRSVVVQRNLDITHLVEKELQLALAQRSTQDRAPPRR